MIFHRQMSLSALSNQNLFLFAYGVKLEAIFQVLKIFNLRASSTQYVNSLLASHIQQKETTKLTLKYFLC